MSKQLHDMTVHILHKTDDAVLVTEDGIKKVWLPLSLVEINSEKDELAEITLPIWLAQEKELI